VFNLLKSWLKSQDAVAATEAALIFPIILMMLLGTYDLGSGILANQKAIRASQVVADLVTRQRTISGTELTEAIEAGRLALEPMDTTSFGVDIVSIAFDENSNPEIRLRETRNMTPMPDVLDRVAALAEPDGGVMVVAVEYDFQPIITGLVVNQIQMQEVAFARGRKSPVVNPE
jgi:Flp pilus assembly protein TadG